MESNIIKWLINNMGIFIATGSLVVAFIALRYSKKAYRRQNDSVTLQENQHFLSLRPEFRIEPFGNQREWFHRTHSQIDYTIVLCENRARDIKIRLINGCKFEQTEYDQLQIDHRIIFAVELPLIVKQNIDLFEISYSDIENAGRYRQVISGDHGFLSITIPDKI